MRRTLLSAGAITLIVYVPLIAEASTIWNGPKITFSKADFADWTLPANQDQLTPNVHLTRADTRGIFNIVLETVFDDTSFTSPLDTEWSYGTTADIGSLTFDTWDDWHGANPLSSIGLDAVLHLITDDIFIDIKFLSWTSGMAGGGGGFSYERSTVPEPGFGVALIAWTACFFLRRRR